VRRRDKMRIRREDDPFMASECEHAQSELTCIANAKKACKYPSNSVLIALLFQKNKSFGVIIICIHPLAYVKPCREQVVLPKKEVPTSSLRKAVSN
jgi:hypothetical protein